MRRMLLKNPRNPYDYLGLRKQKLRVLMLSALTIGGVSLGLWHRYEQLGFGQQRLTAFTGEVSNKHRKPPEILLSVTVFLTGGSSINRDGYFPGWNPGNNIIDCIGGGGGSAPSDGFRPVGGSGGGGMARYQNHPALPVTISYSVGAGGSPGVAGGNTSFNGTVGAYGGQPGVRGQPANGGAGGTYFAGTGYYPGGAGGISAYSSSNGGGGGGGAGGYYGAGGAGGNATVAYAGGNGGAGGAGNGGGGGLGGQPGNGFVAGNGGNGGEYGGAGSGGGGGGGTQDYDNTTYTGGNGGAYGGGGGGTNYAHTAAGTYGYQGLIIIMYVPLTAPVVSSISPNAGSTAGGQAVAISGSGFVNITSVNIGGAPVTGLSYNANTIYGTTSAGGAGTYNVNVNVSGGVAPGAGVNLYTYVAPPTLSSCAPNKGPDIGGTAVTITGAGFGGVTGVTFGGVAATSVVVVNATTITCVAPAHAFGLVNVSISGAYGTADLIGGYTYLPPSGGFNMPMMGI